MTFFIFFSPFAKFKCYFLPLYINLHNFTNKIFDSQNWNILQNSGHEAATLCLYQNFVVRRPGVKADTPWQGASDRLSMVADLFRYTFRCGPRRWVLIGSDQIIVPPVALIVRRPIFPLCKNRTIDSKFMTATFAQT